jgi:V/A-type H+-transporting ATPase subunit A
LSPNDAHSSAAKTAALIDAVLAVTDRADALVDSGVTAAEIEELDFTPLLRAAAETPPDDADAVTTRREQMLDVLAGLR